MRAQHQIVSFLIVLLLVLGTISALAEFFLSRTPEFEQFKLQDKATAIASSLLLSAQFSRKIELNQTGLSCDDPALPLELSSKCPGYLWTNYSQPRGPVINPTPTEYGGVVK